MLATMLAGGSIVSAAQKANAEWSKSLPRALLSGDSICGGYQRGAKKLLSGKAAVARNPGNAQHTGTG